MFMKKYIRPVNTYEHFLKNDDWAYENSYKLNKSRKNCHVTSDLFPWLHVGTTNYQHLIPQITSPLTDRTNIEKSILFFATRSYVIKEWFLA